LDLFFEARSATAGQAYAVTWPILQRGSQFGASTPDRLGVESRDLGDQAVTAVADAVGFEGGIPAALLFVETAEQEVDLGMERPVGMRPLLLAVGTGTGTNLA
jgi:hypothetical protein